MILESRHAWSLAAAGVALAGAVVFPPTRRVAALAGYFSIIQLASLVGVMKGTFGRVEGTWSTARQTEGAPKASRSGFLSTSVRRMRHSAAPLGKTIAYRGGIFWAFRTLRPSKNVAILRYHAI